MEKATVKNNASISPGGSNKLNVLEKFEKLKKVSPASFPCYLRFQHANRNKANNREPRNSYDLEEHERIARVLWEKLEQNWDGRVRKHKSKKRARKVKRSRAREANHPRDPVICLENLTDTLRTAVQITENYKTEEPDPMRGHKSSTEKCLSSKGAVRAACRKVHRKKHSKFGVKKSWLPKELQDHTYAAPPPKHSQKSYKGSGRMTEKKKKIKDPHLKKELAKRRLFIGGFAPCHFLTHGLSGPVEKQDPKSLEDLLKQIFRVEKKSS
ncbi:hypothetical protein Y032_0224g2721 [Ancylostoma ceylanicum]|uniref:Uncharacterized protein n=1 Tax=Ancylostoma ceylanicum TaxID=53326 RepID=A0A016SHI8_9BILA|nr:hypothetical protein Y032_0224g2721 [Ancylostoma ceylanicum]